MKTLFVYAPFCTPATPPYSITYLYSFLKDNTDEKKDKLDVLDLNVEFHKAKFSKYQEYYKSIRKTYDPLEYDKITHDYKQETEKTYSENNHLVVEGKKPELFDEMLKKITDKKPDIVAFSIVYSSQAFYAFAIIPELKKLGIKTIVGGPAANEKLISISDKCLLNEVELLEYITGKSAEHSNLNCNTSLDFSEYNLDDYFVPEIVIPIRTSSTCYYRQCTFCSHYNSKSHYFEYNLEAIRKTVINSKQKHFFLIDDMIHKKRLLELAEIFKSVGAKWTVQLRPTKEFDYETLKTLHESGLSIIMWGVEAASNRVLDLINKGTNKDDVQQVLIDSHKAGIKNVAYIIFGFPTETKEEALATIEFLTANSESIDLVSTSIFGLHQGTKIYAHPEKFGITKIIEEKRTVLEPKVSYEVSSGLTQEQASKIRNNYKRTLEKINKYPKNMNFFREHMFVLVD